MFYYKLYIYFLYTNILHTCFIYKVCVYIYTYIYLALEKKLQKSLKLGNRIVSVKWKALQRWTKLVLEKRKRWRVMIFKHKLSPSWNRGKKPKGFICNDKWQAITIMIFLEWSSANLSSKSHQHLALVMLFEMVCVWVQAAELSRRIFLMF